MRNDKFVKKSSKLKWKITSLYRNYFICLRRDGGCVIFNIHHLLIISDIEIFTTWNVENLDTLTINTMEILISGIYINAVKMCRMIKLSPKCTFLTKVVPMGSRVFVSHICWYNVYYQQHRSLCHWVRSHIWWQKHTCVSQYLSWFWVIPLAMQGRSFLFEVNSKKLLKRKRISMALCMRRRRQTRVHKASKQRKWQITQIQNTH